MASSESTHDQSNPPLYNSRIIASYIKFLNKQYSHLNISPILDYAGISEHEPYDPGCWFTQDQNDRFNEEVTARTGNPHISRDVGRYTVSYEGLGAAKQFALGVINPMTFYLRLEKLYKVMSRGADVRAKRLGRHRVEIVSTPAPGVDEKPYQCDNRMGTFEAITLWFTQRLAKIEHPSCLHKGDECCRYIITWEGTIAHTRRMIRNYSFVALILISLLLFFFLQTTTWTIITLLCVSLVLAFSFFSQQIENRVLVKTITEQGDAAKDQLKEADIRYGNSLFVQEIGHVISTILDLDTLFRTVLGVMDKRLDFDRGMIMIADKENTRLLYKDGYGYDSELEEILRNTVFHLDEPRSKGAAVKAFKEQRPFLINDVSLIEKDLSQKSMEFIRQMGSKSFVSVPIVYENESLGLILADNLESKNRLTQSDINLLMGVASQTAVSIVNARSFQKLQESEKQYRELVENADSLILRVDTAFRVSFINEFASKTLGFLERDLLGKDVVSTVLRRMDPETPLPSVQSLKGGQQHFTIEHESPINDDEQIWVAWTATPIFSRAGRLEEILCVGNDITELMRAESEKKLLAGRLQQSQKVEAIGTLAGGIAHDFNNILGAIMGYTELADIKLSTESTSKGDLKKVLKACDRAKDLVRQILSFSRQGNEERRPIEIHPVVKEALKLLRASLPASIEIRGNPGSERFIVEADPTQIHQILMNLCTNAHHAMQADGGLLEVTLKKVHLSAGWEARLGNARPGPYLRLSVSDTGEGIPLDRLDNIFDPYFTTKDKGHGTGLGLAVVNGIVKSHNGLITVDTKPGEGSTFNVFFPLVDQEGALGEGRSDEQPLPTGSERILFIDDEQNLAEVAGEILETLGYDVTVAIDSIKALALFTSQPDSFDLIISDISMPHMSGEKLAQRILGIRPDLPIILCTGFAEHFSTKDAEAMGVRKLVMKPINRQEFAETIREVLDERTDYRDVISPAGRP